MGIFILVGSISVISATSLASTPASDFGICENVFFEPVNHEVFAWFEGLRERNRRRVNATKLRLNENDIRLMQLSFTNKSRGQPIETGLVEVLTADDRVLYSSSIQYGGVGFISLAYDFRFAMDQAKLFPNAAKIRTTHTHPPALVGAAQEFYVSVFSDADHLVNREHRQLLDRRELENLDLEVKIVFIDPKYIEFVANEETLKQILRTRSYALLGNRKAK